MFIDVAEITVESGSGGDGIVAFRREAHVPTGGPAGGNGGKGGDLYIEVDPGKHTLLDFEYRSRFAAQDGKSGGGSDKTGKSGKDLRIPVPEGTMVYDARTGRLLADLTRPRDELLVACGGAGGRGNAQFASPSRQAPRFAENGEKGEKRTLRLELKLIADVGIIGYPNVGKSTLISQISAAKPEIAPYHFTTLQPNLGVVRLDLERTFTVADVPGLIEGAHEGVGLGHDFLRHIERTRMLVHMVDVSGFEARDPVEDYRIINHELAQHDKRLAELPQIVALNKIDIAQDHSNVQRMEREAAKDGRECVVISAVTQQGVDQLLNQVWRILEDLEVPEQIAQRRGEARHFEVPQAPVRKLNVRRIAPSIYVVRGTEVERLVQRTDLEDANALEYFQTELDRIGVTERLDEAGAAPGDTVFVGNVELEYA